MKKIIIIPILWIFGMITSIIIDSCCPDRDTKYQWESLKVKCLHRSGDIISEANDTISDLFSYDDLGLELNLNGKLVSESRVGKSLFQSSFAYDCWWYFSPKYKIKQFQIETLADFDNNKLKNSDLSSYFKILRYNGAMTSIDEFLNDKEDINNQILTDYTRYDKPLILYLQNKPVLDNFYKFVIKIQLENDIVLTDTTKVIKIKT